MTEQGTQYNPPLDFRTRRFTNTARAIIVDEYFNKQMTMKQISEIINAPVSSISNVIQIYKNSHRINYKPHYSKRKQIDIDFANLLKALQEQGKSVRQISEFLKERYKISFSKSSVQQYLHKYDNYIQQQKTQEDVGIQYNGMVSIAEFGMECELNIFDD